MKQMYLYFLVATLLNIGVHARNCDICPKHEVFNECGSPCTPEPSCEDRNPEVPEICVTSCEPRCECDIKDGYIRNCTDGDCVKVCPDGCNAQETLNTCASLCIPEPTCQYQFPLYPTGIACPKICVIRCECDASKGYIRNKENGKCVDVGCCEKYCANNEVYGCKPCCDEPSCDEPKPDCDRKICPLICINTCLCKEGLVRDRTTGRCVELENCPRYQEN